VDRCALFVDAGYVLADGAMAVHGTRHRGSVSWDYAGLVKLLTGLARDRTGLPVLRCYWYEAAVEGRRSAEHDTLADLPGLKLRLGRIRSGRRAGVETEMHRDLATLARNHAVSDAVIVSAEDDLAEIIAEVQDLGLRVLIVHIAVDGSWTISGPLREECDDIVEVTGAHLRPFVDLIAGAEPAERDEQHLNGSYPTRSYEAPSYQPRVLANGHGGGIGAVTHQGLPAAALPAPPTIYTKPAVEEYRRTAQPAGPDATGSGSISTEPVSPGPIGPGSLASPPPASPPTPAAAVPAAPAPTAPAMSAPPAGPPPADSSPPAGPRHGSHALAPGQAGGPQDADAARNVVRPQEVPSSGRQGSHASQSQPVSPSPGPGDVAFGLGQGEYRSPGQLGPRSGLPVREGPAREGSGLSEGMSREGLTAAEAETGRPAGPAAARFADVSVPAPPAAVHSVPAQQVPAQSMPALHVSAQPMSAQSMAAQPMPAQPMPAMPAQPMPAMPAQPMPAQSMAAQSMAAQPMPGQPMPGHQYPSTPPGQFGGSGPGQMPPHQQFQGSPPGQPPGSGYALPQHEQGPYSGPQPAAHSPAPQPVPQPMTVSLAEALQAAHAEGFGFGDAVARDAPALWLEAVLARKPRMPSDLEARLLQGSALPIDSLLHDEVRHSLRRGFWDALERSRR
jgi:NYN domain